MTEPSISIVVPSLNHAPFLEQALRSLIDQRYPRLEIIVMDGGSTDGSAEILARYSEALAYSQSSADRGPAAALSAGFERAQGDIFGVLNADDVLLPGALALVAAAFAERPDVDVVSGHGYFSDRDGVTGAPLYSDAWTTWRCQNGACVLVQPATFFRRSAYERAGGFRQEHSLCWDMALWADMAAAGARFLVIDQFLAGFRLHPDSITGRPELRGMRRAHAQVVMDRIRGRKATRLDALYQAAARLQKFLSHPARAFRQRLYFFSVLRRWSL